MPGGLRSYAVPNDQVRVVRRTLWVRCAARRHARCRGRDVALSRASGELVGSECSCPCHPWNQGEELIPG